MSRYSKYLLLANVIEVFGKVNKHLLPVSSLEIGAEQFEKLPEFVTIKDLEAVANGIDQVKIRVDHGYDRPCFCYFASIGDDTDNFSGIWYGGVGLGERLDRWTYRDCVKKLGLTEAVEAVEWDNPY